MNKKKFALFGFNLLGWLIVGMASANPLLSMIGLIMTDFTARSIGKNYDR